MSAVVVSKDTVDFVWGMSIMPYDIIVTIIVQYLTVTSVILLNVSKWK